MYVLLTSIYVSLTYHRMVLLHPAYYIPWDLHINTAIEYNCRHLYSYFLTTPNSNRSRKWEKWAEVRRTFSHRHVNHLPFTLTVSTHETKWDGRRTRWDSLLWFSAEEPSVYQLRTSDHHQQSQLTEEGKTKQRFHVMSCIGHMTDNILTRLTGGWGLLSFLPSC